MGEPDEHEHEQVKADLREPLPPTNELTLGELEHLVVSREAKPIIDVDEIAAQPDHDDLAQLPLPDNSDTESSQSSSHISDVPPNSDSSLEMMTALPPLSNALRDSSMPKSKFRAFATRRVMCGSRKYFEIAKDLPPGTVNNIIPLRFS